MMLLRGEVNVDLLKSHPKTDEYLEPTKVTPSSPTLIDHIYTNSVSSPTDAGVIIIDVADQNQLLPRKVITDK